MIFRINFLTFWVGMNVAYAIIIESYAETQTQTVLDGSFGFLEIFAAYLAFLVIYRVFFGSMHIFKFKVLSNCVKKYKIYKVDLHQEFRKLRKTPNWNESVVDNDLTIM